MVLRETILFLRDPSHGREINKDHRLLKLFFACCWSRCRWPTLSLMLCSPVRLPLQGKSHLRHAWECLPWTASVVLESRTSFLDPLPQPPPPHPISHFSKSCPSYGDCVCMWVLARSTRTAIRKISQRKKCASFWCRLNLPPPRRRSLLFTPLHHRRPSSLRRIQCTGRGGCRTNPSL